MGTVLLALMLSVTAAPAPAMVAAATPPFYQGAGYQAGKYDLEAVQPTAFNWSRQSRFTGSPHHDEIWSFNAVGGTLTSPVIGRDGTIYVGTEAGHLHAVDPDPHAAKRVKWSFDAKDKLTSSPAIGEDGTVYVFSVDGNLYALDPDPDAKNRVKWYFAVADDRADQSSLMIDADGTICIGHDVRIYGVRPAADGTPVLEWSTPAHPGESIPAIGADGSIYAGSKGLDFVKISPAPNRTPRGIL